MFDSHPNLTAQRSTGRWSLLIDAYDRTDTLLRLLGPVAVSGAAITRCELIRVQGGVSVRVDTEGLSLDRAESLVARLNAMPIVIGVGLAGSFPTS